jgi:DNA-binding beta-propeller fold protein YncE
VAVSRRKTHGFKCRCADWARRPGENGSVSVLKIDGKKVSKTQDIEVGGLPEAAMFTPDGQYILVGNYLTQDFSILKVDGTSVTDTGKRFQVPGHPASARMGP